MTGFRNVATWRELLDDGWTRRGIERAVREGRLAKLRRGVYCVEMNEVDRLSTHAWALLENVADDAVLSHFAAAVAHGLPVPDWTVKRLRGSRQRDHSGRSYGYYPAPYGPQDVVIIEGIPVTSLARTVVDVTRHLSLPWGLATADAAFALGLDKKEMIATIDRWRRRPGNVKARKIAEWADPLSESPGESWSRGQLMHHGVPRPKLQVEIHDDAGEFVARVDMLWEDAGVIGEFDGAGKYVDDPRGSQAAHRAQDRRDDRLRALGWDVHHWGWQADPAALSLSIKTALAAGLDSGRRGRGAGSRRFISW